MPASAVASEPTAGSQADSRMRMSVEEFADDLSRIRRARFERFYTSPVNRGLLIDAAAKVNVVPGRKYTKIDVGSGPGWTGKFMIENATGEIFGIKAYGVIHRGKRFGNLGDRVGIKMALIAMHAC